jgi:metal-responsive CopG/Arc/MetJ family transcriptional regulator
MKDEARAMRTVQMTLDEKLVAEVDRAVRRLRTNRSAFARQALRAALRRLRELEKERKQIEGYRRKPVRAGEFSVWEKEQLWPEL